MRRPALALTALALALSPALAACGSDGSATAAPPAAAEASPAGGGAHAGHGSSGETTESATDSATEGATGHDHGAGAAGDGHDHAHLNIAESGVGTVIESTGDGYGNLMREAPQDARPTVALRAKADPAGGWTVHLVTTGFQWAPQDVNTPAAAGAGHAHLYVSGTKVARVYGDWVFVPASAAEAGDTLDAVLYANDHTAWAVGGKPVEASVVLQAIPAQTA